MEEFKNHGKKLLYWLTLGIALIIVYKLLDQLPNVTGAIGKFFQTIGPIIVGVFIAYILFTPCKKIESVLKKSKLKIIKNRSKSLSILIVYLIIVALIYVIINAIAPVIVESGKELINNLQGYVEITINKYQELPESSILKSEWISNIINSFKETKISVTMISDYARGAIEMFVGVFNTFVAIIVSIYVLAEKDRIYKFFKKAAKAILKEHTYKVISKYFNSANKIFSQFITSQIIDAIIVSILTTIILTLMKIKYASLLGVVIGVFNVIPYVGAIIAIVGSAIIVLITGGLSQAIWMIVVITILQQIDANIINPKIVGNSLKISPLLVIIAVMIGGKYFGMLGVFLSVPISALIKILAEDYIDYKTKIKKEAKKEENYAKVTNE